MIMIIHNWKMGKGSTKYTERGGFFLNPIAISGGCIPFGAHGQLTDPGLQALTEGRGGCGSHLGGYNVPKGRRHDRKGSSGPSQPKFLDRQLHNMPFLPAWVEWANPIGLRRFLSLGPCWGRALKTITNTLNCIRKKTKPTQLIKLVWHGLT